MKSLHPLLAALVALACFGSTALGDTLVDIPASALIDYPTDHALLHGSGFNLATGMPAALCALSSRAAVTPFASGQQVKANHKIISSMSELEELLDVSASGSFSAGFFSASAKAKFSTSSKVSQYALLATAYSKVSNRESPLDNPQLSESAKAILLRPDGLEQFHKSFGTHFVAAIATGAEYYGMYRYETKSALASTNLMTKISAGGLTWSAEGQLDQATKEMTQELTKSVENIYLGAPRTLPTEMSKMISLAQGLSADAADASKAVPVKVLLQSYACFPEYTDAQARAQFGVGESPVARELGFNYRDYRAMLADIDYVLGHPTQFRFRNLTEQGKLLALLQAKRTEINDRLIPALFDARNKINAGTSKPATFAELGLVPAAQFGTTFVLPPRYRRWNAPLTLQLPPLAATMLQQVPKGTPVKALQDGSDVKAGDGEMMGNYPHVWVDCRLEVVEGGRKLKRTVVVTMQEHRYKHDGSWRGDYSTFRREFTDVVHTAPEGLVLIKVSEPSGEVRAQAGYREHGECVYPGKGVVARAAKTVSDIVGKDFGKIGVGSLEFNPVVLTYRNEEDVKGEPYTLEQYFPGQPPAGSGGGLPATVPVTQPKRRQNSTTWFAARRPAMEQRAAAARSFWFSKSLAHLQVRAKALSLSRKVGAVKAVPLTNAPSSTQPAGAKVLPVRPVQPKLR